MSVAPAGGGRRDRGSTRSDSLRTPLVTVKATRYVAPLREGGSLPALIEASDDGMYVLKFRGAGQGPRALVAELLAGELGRHLGLPVPEIVFVELDPVLGRAEPDPEIQDLIVASAGLNIGLDFLPGALTFDPAAQPDIDPQLAARVVWLDAWLTNVDRTPRNPNLLMWHGSPWLIDHGSALYAHHQSWDIAARALEPFPAIADHVLLPYAAPIDKVDAALAEMLSPDTLAAVASLVPDAWLQRSPPASGTDPPVADRRAAYVDYLHARLHPPRGFAEEAERARLRR